MVLVEDVNIKAPEYGRIPGPHQWKGGVSMTLETTLLILTLTVNIIGVIVSITKR